MGEEAYSKQASGSDASTYDEHLIPVDSAPAVAPARPGPSTLAPSHARSAPVQGNDVQLREKAPRYVQEAHLLRHLEQPSVHLEDAGPLSLIRVDARVRDGPAGRLEYAIARPPRQRRPPLLQRALEGGDVKLLLRRDAGGQQRDHASEGVDVGAALCRRAVHDLGRHPSQGAPQPPRVAREHAGQSEVKELRMRGLAHHLDHDVTALEIAVDDVRATGVHVEQGPAHPDHHRESRETADALLLLAARHELGERHPLDQLEDQGDLVLGRVDNRPMRGHDVGVFEVTKDAQLIAELRDVLEPRLVEPARALHRHQQAAEDAPRHLPEGAGAQDLAAQDPHLLLPDAPVLGVPHLGDAAELRLQVRAVPVVERVEDAAAGRGLRQRVGVRLRLRLGGGVPRPGPRHGPRLPLRELELRLAAEASLLGEILPGHPLAHLGGALAQGAGGDDGGDQHEAVDAGGRVLTASAGKDDGPVGHRGHDVQWEQARPAHWNAYVRNCNDSVNHHQKDRVREARL
eukprot:CAMPEP_0171202496 /NCGR_PEP_ID=MMETSP0790-20130122/25031_1 /TAXON_ID=2925 /ORGANISM="Alexandrium catenella, Strain OF101" /LENGTH=515 /DNA_ID=CAMNT_0011667919 /DNA_START=144 /DNA_END=1693 /DNA_ORIENTATION=-